jgi:hypothetical protein
MVGATGSNQTAKARSTAQAFVFNASANQLTLSSLLADRAASATEAHLYARGSSGAVQREGKIRLGGTFHTSADTGTRLIASLRAGFSAGTWGNEYLDFYLNNVIGNDTSSDANQGRVMRLAYGGNVLIGSATATGTASQPLQVTGGAYFAGVGFATGSIGVGITNPQGAIDIRTSPQWSSFNQGANLILGGSRNNALGILDSTNSNPWAIANGAGTLNFYTMPSLGDTSSTPTSVSILNIQRNGNILIGSATATGTASQPLQVTGGAYVSGNLGVGATIPSTRLEVFNTATSGHLTLAADDAVGSDQTGIDLDWRVKNQGHIVGRIRSYYTNSGSGGSGGLRLFTRNAGTLGEVIRLQPDGAVGIGTISAIRRLHLAQNTAAEFVIEQLNGRPDFRKWNFVADAGTASVTGNFYLRLLNDAGNATSKTYWSIAGSTNTQSLYDNVLINTGTLTGTANQNLQVSGGAYVSGNLGVGVTAPAFKADIAGDARVTSTNKMRFGGTAGTTNFYIQYNSTTNSLDFVAG